MTNRWRGAEPMKTVCDNREIFRDLAEDLIVPLPKMSQ